MRPLHTILAIDIGAGTQDILLYDAGITPENCVCMIVPAPWRHFAKIIERSESDIFIAGDPIGGGAISTALLQHLRRGFRVIMSEDAAYTVRNSLSEVMQYGISIAAAEGIDGFAGKTISFREIDWPLLREFLSSYDDVGTPDLVAVAVQDHGVPPAGVSNRVFRFKMLEQQLRKDNRLASFVYSADDLPACFKRMGAVARRAQAQCGCDALVMDTCLAAILGCLENNGPALVVNVGNSHTIAALVRDDRIIGLLEHHTGCLSTEKLDSILVRFIRGGVSSEEIFNDGGHGVVMLERNNGQVDQTVTVTGPNRHMLTGSRLNVHFAAPHGNMMLTGSFGLIRAAHLRFGCPSALPPTGG